MAITQKEIAAIITHVAFYAGWPKGGQSLILQKRFGMRTKQRNNLAETARHERVAQNTDVYAVKARNYKGLRRGSPVYAEITGIFITQKVAEDRFWYVLPEEDIIR